MHLSFFYLCTYIIFYWYLLFIFCAACQFFFQFLLFECSTWFETKEIILKWKVVSFVRRSTLVIEDNHFIYIVIRSALRNWQIWLNNFKNSLLFICKCITHQAMRNMYTKIKKVKANSDSKQNVGNTSFFSTQWFQLLSF